MIVQNIDSNTQIVFTDNIQSGYLSIANELGYTKKDGSLYKYVAVEFSQMYHPRGAQSSMPCIKLIAKGVETYIVSNSFDFILNADHIRNAITGFEHFGGNYIPVIDSIEFNGPFNELTGKRLQDKSGKTISFAEETVPDNSSVIHKVMHRLATDNGHMLAPIIKRYLNTIHLFKGNKNLLTGYAKLDNYLRMIKQPSIGVIQDVDDGIDADYVIAFQGGYSQARVVVVGVRDGVPVIELKFSGSLQSHSKKAQRPEPYVLLTTKPINLGREKMPYNVVSYRGTAIFVTPLIFNSSKILSELKGGINLLK